MGSIGGLLGVSGGAGGTGFNTPSGTNSAQLQTAYGNTQTAMGNQGALLSALQGQNGLSNQNQVYSQLQGVASGQGPNPAQAMLNQSTGQNVANQAALMAGQRGASQNVGLMARQNAQQGAQIQQQAAGQGASMQAQQALGAIGQAGQMANTMASNQIGQTNANVASQQGEQNTLQGANTANNAVQGQLANTTMQGQQGLLGGVMNSAGAASGLFASGGPVDMSSQGAFGPQSMFAQALSGSSSAAQVPSFGSSNPGAQALANVGKHDSKKPAKPSQTDQMNQQLPQAQQQFQQQLVQPGQTSQPTSNSTDMTAPINPNDPTENINQGDQMYSAHGGEVKAVVSPGERFIPPEKVKAVADGKVSPMNVGTQFPGKPKVKGDNYENDVIPTKLPAGGFVIPNSIMQSANPEKKAVDFVRSYLAKKGKRA